MRNQVAAVVLVLVFLFVVDPAIASLVDAYSQFSLSGLGDRDQRRVTGRRARRRPAPAGRGGAGLGGLHRRCSALAAAVLTARRDI